MNKKVEEDNSLDPITMINFILNKSMENQAFSWASPNGNQEPMKDVYDDAPNHLDNQGSYDKVGVNEDATPLMDAEFTSTGSIVNMPAQVTPASGDINQTNSSGKAECNQIDKSVVSSDPKQNDCPAYFGAGNCKIDGRPCCFTSFDKKECSKYQLAKSLDPQTWQVPPGREIEDEYIRGSSF